MRAMSRHVVEPDICHPPLLIFHADTMTFFFTPRLYRHFPLIHIAQASPLSPRFHAMPLPGGAILLR